VTSPAASDDTSEPGARERLLDAAIHIAGHEGRERVTYRAVASRAGVAHGLVRHYFGSRERLLEEALHRASSSDSDETGIRADHVEVFARELVSVLNHDPARALLQYDTAIAAVRGQAHVAHVRSDYEQYFAAIGATFEALGIEDPDGVWARVLFGALDGLSLQHLLFGADDETSSALEAVRELLRMLAERTTP